MMQPPAAVAAAAALLALGGCAGREAPANADCAPPAPAHVRLCDDVFAPRTAAASPSKPVEWTNAGTHHHTVTVERRGSTTPGDTLTDSGDLAPGATYSFAFPAAGTYDVFCRYHSQGGQAVFAAGMVMRVVVG